jgi:hypothetical protein
MHEAVMRPSVCLSFATAITMLALLAACATSRPWPESQYWAASQAAAEGNFELAYTQLDSLIAHGDATVCAAAIARIKADPRIIAGGYKVVYQMLVLNASSIDAADFESETRFRDTLQRRHSTINVMMERYKALAPDFNEKSVFHAVYEETRISNVDRIAAYQRRQGLDAAALAARQQLIEQLTRAESRAQHECGVKVTKPLHLHKYSLARSPT